jgi:signal transduction histidine kinase
MDFAPPSRHIAKEIGTEMHAEWTVAIPDARYTWTLEELAYRIVREALTNIRKHSHADRFSVKIVERTGRLAGVVQDDGRGLITSEETSPGHHLGVEGMKERARLAGGDLTITSTKGQGVRVTFALPTGEHT